MIASSDPSSVSRRYYRRLYWLRHDVRYWRELLNIRSLVYLGGGGIGDSLNCSAIVHEWRRCHGSDLSVMTPHPELFLGNPEVRSVHRYDHDLAVALQRWGRPVVHPGYLIPQAQPPRPPCTADHLIAQLCRQAGVVGDVALRPRFYFLPGEKEKMSAYRDIVAVQSSCLNSRHALPAKNWPVERMQAVVDALRPRFRLVQVGHRGDAPLHGVEDLRGQNNLREIAALLAHARFFLGLVGFLMHLARAVETRSVIVYGGREYPLQSGYVANENLVGITTCAPCGINDACTIGHDCMKQILPAHVLAAVDRLESRRSQPLETATVTLS